MPVRWRVQGVSGGVRAESSVAEAIGARSAPQPMKMGDIGSPWRCELLSAATRIFVTMTARQHNQ
jgi:hypothetical protein